MKIILALLIALFISACSCSKELTRPIDQDFIGDLASENNRIAGDLYFDMDSDLSSLTYDDYLTYITMHESASSVGFSKKVKGADYHYFSTSTHAFVVALYYINERTLLCDNSNTAFLDSVIVLEENETVPELSAIADKIANK